MIETHAALRAETLARAAPTHRIQGPVLPRPRSPLKERLLCLLHLAGRGKHAAASGPAACRGACC